MQSQFHIHCLVIELTTCPTIAFDDDDTGKDGCDQDTSDICSHCSPLLYTSQLTPCACLQEQKQKQREREYEKKREQKARDRQLYYMRHTRDYETLELPVGASRADVKAAYRKLAKVRDWMIARSWSYIRAVNSQTVSPSTSCLMSVFR